MDNAYCETEQKVTTPAGLEPTRDKPNRFLVGRLNRSATVSSMLLNCLIANYDDALR